MICLPQHLDLKGIKYVDGLCSVPMKVTDTTTAIFVPGYFKGKLRKSGQDIMGCRACCKVVFRPRDTRVESRAARFSL